VKVDGPQVSPNEPCHLSAFQKLTEVAVLIDGRILFRFQWAAVDGFVAVQEVVRDGHGEDGAAPSVRSRCTDHGRIVVQQNTRRSSLAVTELLVRPNDHKKTSLRPCTCGHTDKPEKLLAPEPQCESQMMMNELASQQRFRVKKMCLVPKEFRLNESHQRHFSRL